MKKNLLLLLTLLVFTSYTHARKTWDFRSSGISSTSVELILSDTENWAQNGTDTRANCTANYSLSGGREIYAGGEVLPEFSELYLDGITAGKGNNFIEIRWAEGNSYLRLNKSAVTVTLKGLVGGQQIAIVTKSANNSTARGISCKSGNATRTAGEETLIEENENIFVVNADVTDSTDVTFYTPQGGIYIYSIIVDDGDPTFDDETTKIAYLYDSSYATYCGIDDDPVFNYTVIAEKETEAIDIKEFTAESTDTLSALENYDIVIVSEAMSSGHPFAKMLVKEVNRVPMLNLKSFLYKSTVWNWGAGQNPTAKAADEGGISILTLTADADEHPLFKDVDIEDDGTVDMFIYSDPALIRHNLMQAYTTTDDKLIANDKVLATVGGYNAIHEHGSENIYMLIPISCDALVIEGEANLSDAALQIINNAVNYLADSKSSVRTCVKPVISQTNNV